MFWMLGSLQGPAAMVPSPALAVGHTARHTAFRCESPVMVPPPASAVGRTARKAAFRSFRHADATDVPMDVVEGEVPSWLSGAYVRNGPGLFEAGERRLEHWFDGYAMVVGISIRPGRLPTLTTSFIDSEAHRAARAGAMRFPEFMTPLAQPDSGWRSRAAAIGAMLGAPTDNACVNVVRHAGRLVAMTETQRSWVELAAPAGGRGGPSLSTRAHVAWRGDDVGQLGTAHPQRDPRGGGMINVATRISPPFSSSYNVYRLDDASPHTRETIASLPCADRAAPDWMHSFGHARTPHHHPRQRQSLAPLHACLAG